jgi:hypothetical protein
MQNKKAADRTMTNNRIPNPIQFDGFLRVLCDAARESFRS